MKSIIIALVLVVTVCAILPPAEVHAAGNPPPQIPPVTWSCYVSTANSSNYVPATTDSSTALQAVNCPKVAKAIADKINGGSAVINRGILIVYGVPDWTSRTIQKLVAKLKK